MREEVDLVTGGSGFIGSHLTQLLMREQRKVRVVDIRIPSYSLDEKTEFIQGSVTDEGLMRRVLKGVKRVFHVAANPNLWDRDKKTFAKVNVLGTKVALDEALQSGVEKIVYTSTESILKGASHRGEVIDESAQSSLKDMPGVYCRSKFLAEQYALSLAKNGAPIVVVNPTLPIGPGDSLLTPPTRMILNYLNRKNPGYIDFCMNLIDVRDVAQGHLLAMEKGRIGQRYILGCHNICMKDFLGLLQELSGVSMPTFCAPYWIAFLSSAVFEIISDYVTKQAPLAPFAGVRLAHRPMIFDSQKAVKELGLPQSSLSDAIRDTLSWAVQERLWIKPKTVSNYQVNVNEST